VQRLGGCRWSVEKCSAPGRPAVDAEVRALVRRMSRENATWGALRIRAELHLLGLTVVESTVAKYMNGPRKLP